MDVVYTHWCGIDVGKKAVVACLRVPGEDGRAKKTIRRFGTMTEDLERLADWLRGAGCLQVAMESTGVYSQPVWNVLEAAGAFELVLVNARHVKTSSADYPYEQHGLSRRDGGDHRSYPSPLRPDPPAG